ncbi:hypothetical protein HY251_01430 [bacterium]|nr:hypothetical protein [bacterium]
MSFSSTTSKRSIAFCHSWAERSFSPSSARRRISICVCCMAARRSFRICSTTDWKLSFRSPTRNLAIARSSRVRASFGSASSAIWKFFAAPA